VGACLPLAPVAASHRPSTRSSAAHTEGLSVIAKRPLANAPWRFADRPVGHEAELYWERWQALDPERVAGSNGAPALPGAELAMRFVAHTPGVSSAIVGTRSLPHLRTNLDLVARGPLPITQVVALRARFAEVGGSWPSRI
jgi:aryl-alcohol dehydrogenase-like predicted oxidoreductase